MDGGDNGSLVRVRAAVHLRGLRVGDVADVDPDDPYIAGLIASQMLVYAPEAQRVEVTDGDV